MTRQSTLLPGSWLRPNGEQVYEPRKAAPADPVSVPYADSDTSEEASRRALPRAGSDARRILGLIRLHGGLTCDEVEVLTNLPHQTASARIRGLRSGGWITDGGRRRLTQRGRSAVVWEAVE